VRRFLTVAVLLLTLCGCASDAAGPATATPTVSSSPTPTTFVASSTPTPTPSQSSLTIATKAFCRGTLRDSEDGLDAILELVKHPDGEGLSAEDFSVPRDNLSEDEKLAPAHLKKYLRTQIAVLNDIVDVLNGEGNRTIQTGKYRDASYDFVIACGKDLQ
jgi:hypothetical protein